MEELNEDLDTLDDEIDGYIIYDADEVALKTRVWEEMNKDYLDAQAEKAQARAEAERLAAERGEPIGGANGGSGRRGAKRQRKDGVARAADSAGEAAAAELRRNKISSRINYDVVQILSQTLEEDAEHMPDGMEHMPDGDSAGEHALSGGAHPLSPTSSGHRPFSATPSGHSSNASNAGTDDPEPFY